MGSTIRQIAQNHINGFVWKIFHHFQTIEHVLCIEADLKSFAVLKAPVDTFFDKVMVMVEDKALRSSRLALLRDLRESMNRVADLSRLAT